MIIRKIYYYFMYKIFKNLSIKHTIKSTIYRNKFIDYERKYKKLKG